MKQQLRATPRLKDEKFGTLYGNHIRPLIKKGNCPKSRPRDYLWISCKEVLYGHSERSGVLYGNHIYTVSWTLAAMNAMENICLK